jgi:hypothetical protein
VRKDEESRQCEHGNLRGHCSDCEQDAMMARFTQQFEDVMGDAERPPMFRTMEMHGRPNEEQLTELYREGWQPLWLFEKEPGSNIRVLYLQRRTVR